MRAMLIALLLSLCLQPQAAKASALLPLVWACDTVERLREIIKLADHTQGFYEAGPRLQEIIQPKGLQNCMGVGVDRLPYKRMLVKFVESHQGIELTPGHLIDVAIAKLTLKKKKKVFLYIMIMRQGARGRGI